MSTSLYIISNIKTNKAEVVRKKDIYLKQLKALKLDHTFYFNANNEKIMDEGDWVFELYKDSYGEEFMGFNSPFVFGLSLYEDCLLISTIYKYSYLYKYNSNSSFFDFFTDYYQTDFRKDIFNIISIFGGTEIIYLADNGCDKIGTYLACYIEEGVSYNEVKTMMKKDGTPFANDFNKLDYKGLDYANIKEYLCDDFSNFKELQNNKNE